MGAEEDLTLQQDEASALVGSAAEVLEDQLLQFGEKVQQPDDEHDISTLGFSQFHVDGGQNGPQDRAICVLH